MAESNGDRLVSLDLLRGLDMFLLTVIGPLVWALDGAFGLPDAVLFQFTHPWEGFTLWDIIMPLFLFMCGAAIPLSLERRIVGKPGQQLVACCVAIGLLVATLAIRRLMKSATERKGA